MSDLKTLREESAKVSHLLRDLRQTMTYAEADLAAFADLGQTDQVRDLVDATTVALYNAAFVTQRLSFKLDSIHEEIRVIEESEKTQKLIVSHQRLMAAFNAAIESAEAASKI